MIGKNLHSVRGKSQEEVLFQCSSMALWRRLHHVCEGSWKIQMHKNQTLQNYKYDGTGIQHFFLSEGSILFIKQVIK